MCLTTVSLSVTEKVYEYIVELGQLSEYSDKAMGWTTGVQFSIEAAVGSGAFSASCLMGDSDSFPGG